MSLILNIDTSTETAHVSIARDGIVLQDTFNNEQKSHGSFLQPAIKKILSNTGVLLNEINAVAVTEGPGSYTGIRIGMASAKGLCYALNKPLITVNTLEVMSNSAIIYLQDQSDCITGLLCPMIDARRMEVFTAIYNSSLENILAPCANMLTEHSFDRYFELGNVNFFGSGSEKWKNVCTNKNAFFYNIPMLSSAMSVLSAKKLEQNSFASTAYTAPLYIKEFYING